MPGLMRIAVNAKRCGCTLIGIEHHLLVPHISPLLTGGSTCVENREEVASFFADAGLKYMFVGHSHIQHTDSFTSRAGNKITEVNVGALSGYPAPIVDVSVLENGRLEYNVRHLKSFLVNGHETDAGDYLARHACDLIFRITECRDKKQFAERTEALGINSKKLLPLWPVIKPLLKKIDTALVWDAYKFLKAMHLQGNVTRSWSGDMKEFFLTAYHENDKSGRKEYLPRILTGDNHNYQINSVSWIQQEPQQEWAALTGEVINSSAVQIADNEFYIELDLHNDLFDQPIDTAKRIHDYELPLRCRIVRHTELEIPAGYVLSYCPKGISIHTPQGILCCSYKTERNKIIFRKIMEITEKRIPRNEITIWNTHLRKWADASNEQIILKKQ